MNELTQEELMAELHYDPETGVFTRVRSSSSKSPAGSVAGYTTNQGYVAISVRGVEYKAHRLAWLYVYGHFPVNQLDHINRQKGDNRIANLREVTIPENQQNVGLRKDNKSGHAGVRWDTKMKKWVARIKVSGRYKHLGCFDDFSAAVIARKQAELTYHPFKVDISQVEGRT